MGTGETSIWGKIKHAMTILFGKWKEVGHQN